MDLRLDVALSLLTGVGEIAVLLRLAALDAVLRYWYFSLYLICGALQCTVWLMGPPTSAAYATFWLCTTPLMIGLRIAVVAELWNHLSDKRGENQHARRFALTALCGWGGGSQRCFGWSRWRFATALRSWRFFARW